MKTKNRYSIAQILGAWEAAYGEDMMTEYSGFIQRLTEEEKKEADQPKKEKQLAFNFS